MNCDMIGPGEEHCNHRSKATDVTKGKVAGGSKTGEKTGVSAEAGRGRPIRDEPRGTSNKVVTRRSAKQGGPAHQRRTIESPVSVAPRSRKKSRKTNRRSVSFGKKKERNMVQEAFREEAGERDMPQPTATISGRKEEEDLDEEKPGLRSVIERA